MIVSASRTTDIAAFYSDWLMHRIKDGFFYNQNPINPKQIKGFSLAPYNVDALVFWTKNPKPLMKHLKTLQKMDYRMLFLYTLNGYNEVFEPNLPPVEERVETFLRLSDKVGKEKVIWRYDPIIVSSLTSIDYHLEQFYRIAKKLHGHTDRVMVSFEKEREEPLTRWEKHRVEHGIQSAFLSQPPVHDILKEFASEMKKVANYYKIALQTCSESEDFTDIGIERGACIDGTLIRKLFNVKLQAGKDPSTSPSCLCAESVDMGMPMTCPNVCTFCAYNYDEELVRANVEAHTFSTPMLAKPIAPPTDEEADEMNKDSQCET